MFLIIYYKVLMPDKDKQREKRPKLALFMVKGLQYVNLNETVSEIGKHIAYQQW